MGLLPIAPSGSLVQGVALVETINISDDEEEIDWDSLEREIDAEEKVEVKKEVVKAEKKKVEKERKIVVEELVPSSSSSSGDSVIS